MLTDPFRDFPLTVRVKEPVHLSPGATFEYSFNNHSFVVYRIHLAEIIFGKEPRACSRQLVWRDFHWHNRYLSRARFCLLIDRAYIA
jgi:hypothetical protein